MHNNKNNLKPIFLKEINDEWKKFPDYRTLLY